ncbi:YceD family protein [Altererythrobacter rubellus]|uniref:YceD family protein n=1 Tax=Altererythrobacter rubellus TaxID=2173831 RepID=A0A9Y2F4T9_9SPHN|nr:YceD family protein [Altererythrobacter rubellus]WIW95438.1 YceD family protein [Altererythrobacter rubellus]
MSESELSRPIKVRALPADPVVIEASEAERAVLAERFSLTSVDDLHATIELEQRAKTIRATGTLKARITQVCAISREDFVTKIEEPLAFSFVEEFEPEPNDADEIEIELAADDLDEIEYSGITFDLGEAVAQSLGLAIDPYAEGPNADAARKAAGISSDDEPSGPLAEALKSLKKD